MTVVRQRRILHYVASFMFLGGMFALLATVVSRSIAVLAGPMLLAVFVVPIIVALAGQRLILRRASSRLRRYVSQGDFVSGRALLDELLDAAGENDKARASLMTAKGTFWAREGLHAEAAEAFAGVERDGLDSKQRFMVLERWAFSLVMLDEAEAAVDLAREAGEELGALDASLPRLAGTRVAWHGTLGAALVVAGKHAEAVPILEAALAQPGSAPHVAGVAFFLGEAFAALGMDREAAELWVRASQGDANGELGARARARLGETRSPYRGRRPS